MKTILFDLPLVGRVIKRKIINKEGGDKTSNTLRKYVKERCKVEVGMYSYGSCFDLGFNVGYNKITIGRYCSLGQSIRAFGANHPMEHAVMSAYFYNSSWGGLKVNDVPRGTLEIGHDVWIGYGTIITSKCHKIGSGAVIGAGAIVTADIPPYAVVVGSPAKVKNYRFSQDIIDLLEKSKWWERTPEALMNYYELIEKPEEWAKAIIRNSK